MQSSEQARQFSRTAGDRSATWAAENGSTLLDPLDSLRVRSIRGARRLLRPVLHPIREALDRRADPRAVAAAGSFPLEPGGGSIRAITRTEFDALAAQHAYYRGRGRYLGAAAWAASDLIERFGLTSALELGPNLHPLVVGADLMDRRAQPGLRPAGRLTVHDATMTPWPVGRERYDLFVALQVFEHLGSAQRQAFAEVRRISRHAIISLPIDWTMDDPMNAHHGISHEQALSWFAPTRPTRVLIGNRGHRQRLIYTFENLG